MAGRGPATHVYLAGAIKTWTAGTSPAEGATTEDRDNDRTGRFHRRLSRRYTGGVREFTVEARNLRGVIKAMDQLYPGLGHHLEEETTVGSTAPSTRPPISSRSERAARSSSSPNSKGVRPISEM